MSNRFERKPGKFSQNRAAWITLDGTEIILYANPVENLGPVKEQYALVVVQPMKKPISIGLTAFTHEEMVALREFLTHVLDRVEPDTIALDEWAKEEWDKGNDSLYRVYRRSPELVIRERKQPEHDPGVPSGPDGTSNVDGDHGDGQPDRGRDSNEALPESEQGELEAQDNPSQDQRFPGVGSVDGQAGLPG